MPRIRFTTLFAERIGGVSAVDVPATTVESALRALTERHNELLPLVWTKAGALNPVMVVFLNDRQLTAGEIGTAVAPGDQIDIVPALEGG
jgi:molybdopterin converting factor small subunit